MWRQSYGRVTIDAICERAGVKKSSFYHAYPDEVTFAIEAFEFAWKNKTKPWLEPAVAEKVVGIFRRSSRYITTALRDAQTEDLIEIDDADEVARDVLTLVEGDLTQARITNSADPICRLPLSVGRLIAPPSNLTVS